MFTNNTNKGNSNQNWKNDFSAWENTQKTKAKKDVLETKCLHFGFTKADLPTDPVQRAMFLAALEQ